MAPQLNTMVLPEAMNWARDYAAPESSRPEGYESAYDRYTLFYDAIYIKKKRSVCLIQLTELIARKVVRWWPPHPSTYNSFRTWAASRTTFWKFVDV